MGYAHHTRVLALRSGVAAVMLVFTAQGTLATTDPLIEGARQCTQYFPQQERANNIPTHLLAAIATTESGRHHDGLGMNVPWPWTINVEGKGYFFATKAEAIANTRNFLSKGYESIDVGCMQVNLKHHPAAFANLDEAFDPAKNVAYAAKFLHDNYASSGDWIKATAAYHSRTPQYGEKYLAQIERSWNSIVGKVAAARASKEGGAASPADAVGNTTLASANTTPHVTQGIPAKNPTKQLRALSTVPRVESRSALHSPLVIKVSEASHPNPSQVLVVHPSPVGAKPVAVAEASVTSVTPMPASTPVGNTIRRVKLDNASVSDDSGHAPNYIFAN